MATMQAGGVRPSDTADELAGFARPAQRIAAASYNLRIAFG